MRLSKPFIKTTIALAISNMALQHSVNATTINVGGTCDIRSAVLSANSDMSVSGCTAGSGADTLVLVDGDIHYVTDTELTISSEMTIQSDQSHELAVPLIRNDPGEATGHRIFNVNGSGNLSIDQVSIYGGSTSSNGGGILIASGGSVTLDTMVVTSCEADYLGGAIFVTDGAELVISNSHISTNMAGTLGGAIYSAGDLTIVSESRIDGNYATSGAGLAIVGTNSTLTLSESNVTTNQATAGGGGVAIGSSADAQFSNCSIAGNGAASSGAMVISSAVATITNCTISENTASSLGGGLIIGYSTVDIVNSIVAGNSAPTGSEIAVPSGGATIVSGRVNLFGHSGVDSVDAFDGFTPDSKTIIATGDGTNPTSLTSIIESFALNDAAIRNFALPSGSPALDVADVNECPSTDQLGERREISDTFYSVKASNNKVAVFSLSGDCDLGSYEG